MKSQTVSSFKNRQRKGVRRPSALTRTSHHGSILASIEEATDDYDLVAKRARHNLGILRSLNQLIEACVACVTISCEHTTGECLSEILSKLTQKIDSALKHFRRLFRRPRLFEDLPEGVLKAFRLVAGFACVGRISPHAIN